MPFLSRTKGSRVTGWQTFARARELPDELKKLEMDYLSMRDWYVNMVGRIAQYEEAVEQARASRNHALQTEYGNKLHGLYSELKSFRDDLKNTGRNSFGHAFWCVSRRLLDRELFIRLEKETESYLGRPADELKSQRA